MNPSDEKTLQDFLGQLAQASGVTKDPQADALIQRAVARQPDAAYLLVQRALLVDQALANARARIAELESQTTRGGGGFLDPNSWGNSAQGRPSNPVPGVGQDTYRHTAPVAVQPAQRGGFLGGAGGGMLGTIAATAAGVAAGSFLFQGIGNLLGNHGAERGANHLLADNPAGEGGQALAGDVGSGSLADQAGIDAIDEPGALDDPLADSNNEDSLGGFFDGDGSDEGVFG